MPTAATAAAREASPLLLLGVSAHDPGLLSDRQEKGADLNVEVLFTPLFVAGMPRPHLGASLSLDGGTSVAYAGLTFPLHDSRRWFGNGFVGGALHDGPLRKAPAPCGTDGDCGFGTRLLPRLGLEWGYYLSGETAISLYFDYLSSGLLRNGEHEDIDHLGLRYRRPF